MDAIALESTLSQFTGTEQWHRYSILFRNILLTDGAKFLAEEAGAYWLMDVIASHQMNPLVQGEYFQVWTLTVRDGKGEVVCDDGNGNVLARQRIPYTDFPLPEISLYAIQDGSYRIILLPSEY